MSVDNQNIWNLILSSVFSLIPEENKELFNEFAVEGTKFIKFDEDFIVLQILNSKNHEKYSFLYKNVFNKFFSKAFNLVLNKDYKLRIIKIEDYGFDKIKSFNLLKNLNKNQTFDNFIVTKNNKKIVDSSLLFFDNDNLVKKPFNTLFIYGASGTGKTHFLNAFVNHALKLNNKVFFLSSDNFSNFLQKASLSNNSGRLINALKENIFDCDFFVLDDVQLLEKREASKSLLFEIMNYFIDSGKTIIISSDKYPNELKKFDERLISRFKGGISFLLLPPDFNSLPYIIKEMSNSIAKLFNLNNFVMSDEVIDYIKSNYSKNYRELQGVINNIINFSKMNNVLNIKTIDDINEVINPMQTNSLSTISLEEIIDSVCSYYQISKNELLSSSKNQSLTLPRQIVMFIAVDRCNMQNYFVSNKMNRSHSTVSNSVKKVKKLSFNNQEINKIVNFIIRNT